jgi:hypothetical protein
VADLNAGSFCFAADLLAKYFPIKACLEAVPLKTTGFSSPLPWWMINQPRLE